MAKNKLTQLEQKKIKLQEELSRIQNDLDTSLDEVRDDVATSLEPKNIIRKYPLQAVGASILVGFLAGKKRKPRTSGSGTGSKKVTGVVGAIIANELKNALTKKGIHFLLDYIDDKIADMKEEHRR